MIGVSDMRFYKNNGFSIGEFMADLIECVLEILADCIS
jgi:hypothetical protein